MWRTVIDETKRFERLKWGKTKTTIKKSNW